MEISKHNEHDRIIELLEKNFIKPNNISLNDVYQNLIDYSLSDESNYKIFKQKIGFTSKDCLEKNYLEQINLNSGLSIFASDLPIYIKSKKQNAKTILVCAMDSLPPEPNIKNTSNLRHEQFEIWDKIGFDLKSSVGFWGPFSLLNPDSINKKDPNVVFFTELLTEYNLYVTDIYKLFFYKDKGNDKFSKSNSISKYKNIKNHELILGEEINIIKPHCIITLGNNSRNALLKISKQKPNSIPNWSDIQEYKYISKDVNNLYQCKIISSPHISGSANGAKACVLQNYNNIIEDSTTKKMAKIIISKIDSIK